MYPSTDTRPPLIFISHSSADNGFARALIELLTAIGVDTKDIVCTSEEGFGVSIGKEWPVELRNHFTNYRVFVIIIHSSHLYNSPVSMNEMGAAWVLDCPIFSFLVKGFFVSSMSGVLTQSHQCVLVGKKDISSDLDQLKDSVLSLFNIHIISDTDWVQIRERFIKTVDGLPPDKGIIKGVFDIHSFEQIHFDLDNPFVDRKTKHSEMEVSWADILKVVAPVLRTPHSEGGLVAALRDHFPGIMEDDVTAIIDKLRSFGLADVSVSTTDFDGVSEAWFFTEEGRNAYDRAMNYHKQPVFQQRDKNQVIELMSCFSTSVMDEYLREGPDYVGDLLLLSSVGWKDIVRGSAFQIYNPILRDTLEQLCDTFFELTDHGECYVSIPNRKYKLVRPGLGPVNKDYEEKIRLLDDLFPQLSVRYSAFIGYIKTHYPEIDLVELSKQFEKEYGR